ncbi:hypothetical protein [Arthrobacter sp. NicSoilB11]|uniref:hypothetical protein n=1 Tax=Arthrobacter sp. NicSoilB11 TaxID=2830999 RepID=UPI0010664FE7|nr:hypothetical protein [Arthrobacter sp. NicSoilB11]BCW75755.1 hypothetical protein NicSoilB11_20800 [Arthrobacter sp. NicSoilB11]
MFHRQKRFTAYGSTLMLVLATLTVTSAATAAAAQQPPELCGPGSAINFDPSDFQTKPHIDNKWFPLKPGMQFTTTGEVSSSDGVHAHSVVSTVTGLTKVIDGITTQVVWDRDYDNGELVESELAFFAQSTSGAVWLFGEYPEEYENGKLAGAPSTFISGIAKAQAGIAMKATPRTDTPPYVQAYAPKVDFLDCGQVFKQDQHVCVPTGCYNDVLVIDEFNPLEPPDAGHQRKFYSAGTGLVKVTAVGGSDQEFMDLVKVRQLDARHFARVNEEALEQDTRGYEVSRSVYAKTPRAQLCD